MAERKKAYSGEERRKPSQEEQDMVAWYVLKRPLVRPDTSYKKAIIAVLTFVIINLAITLLLYFAYSRFGLSSFLPESIREFVNKHKTACFFLEGVFQFIISGMIFAKKAVIGAIKLYQRYAPEDVRRKCLFKPTCSEYAIIAVEKYGVVIGLLKARERLFKRCKGRIYMIDEP